MMEQLVKAVFRNKLTIHSKNYKLISRSHLKFKKSMINLKSSRINMSMMINKKMN
jgi:hypothetical protein